MAFVAKPLVETWFHELDLANAGIPPHRNPRETWLCAVDESRGMLFFQLLSNSSEMRDGTCYYVLAVGRELHTVTWHDREPWLVWGQPAWRRPPDEIRHCAEEANRILLEANSVQPPKGRVASLDPDGA
jgi:hypothetical protein